MSSDAGAEADPRIVVAAAQPIPMANPRDRTKLHQIPTTHPSGLQKLPLGVLSSPH